YCVVRDSFFFSSRRRHTRSKRDWSSDVCSSDLVLVEVASPWRQGKGLNASRFGAFDQRSERHATRCIVVPSDIQSPQCEWEQHRSEERRVGKESRSRGWQRQQNSHRRAVMEEGC